VKLRAHASLPMPGMALLAVSLLAASMQAPAQQAQQTCYQDSSGRILTRRTPGTREVPCPAQGTPRRTEPAPAPPNGSSTGNGANGNAGAGNAGGATSSANTIATDAAPTAADLVPIVVSPIPRPGSADFVESVPLPDRWRLVDALGYRDRWWDPYNRNVLKGDKPVHGDWFFNLGVVSDTVAEIRQVAESAGLSSSDDAGTYDAFGRNDQLALVENLAAEFVYYKGDTVFKPPEWEFRFTPVLNINRARLSEVRGVNADPGDGNTRNDLHLGVQAAFVDHHLRNVSDNYDFDSLRIGIQPFSSDFRGFLFQDNQLGIRLFGTRASNRYQYNLAYFRRLEKDTNSGLNDVTAKLRHDDVLVANLYRQDSFVPGFTSQFTLLYNRNTEDGSVHYDTNGFIQRPASLGREVPRGYDVLYAGYSGDGHFGRWNLTTSLYGVIGREKPGVFVDAPVDVRAGFAAAELSMDFDWLRPRLSLLYASGDKDPFDDVATGFDAVFENPQFAGGDTSYWVRQAIPLVGGGGVALSGRNGVLPSLRPSKDEGQSNFTNPGLMLVGVGLDVDLLPTLRASFNMNTLYFADTSSIEAARAQAGVGRHVGYDLSTSMTWRPLMTQNIVLRGSFATLLQGKGLDALYPHGNPRYLLLNAVFTY
jgi:hypothetical protein